MDANVLRAALAAAIRVTVTGALVGCGGTTVADPQSSGHREPSSSGPPDDTPPMTSSGGTAPSSSPSPTTAQNSAGTHPDTTAGWPASNGGAQEGGAPAAGGGAPSIEPEPTSFCEAPATKACEPIFDALVADPPLWTEPLEPEALACCQALVTALDPANTELEIECRQELNERLDAVRFPCCPALEFQGQACTPWGPPVPPELDLERLLSRSAAA